MTVVVPAYNEEKYLGALLTSLWTAVDRYRASRGREVEVVVVDNASTDRTAEVARAHGARVVREEKRQIAAARNAGARAAHGELIVTCDADNRVSENLLERIDDVMSDGRHVGGGVRIRPEVHRWGTDLVLGLFDRAALFFGLSFGVLYTDRDTFWRVGGFPESVYVGEDGFFVLALKREGRRVGKAYANLRDAYIRTSLRKFEEFGLVNVLWQHFKFLLMPWRLRRAASAPTWYRVRR